MKKIISNKEKNLISKLKSQYDIVCLLYTSDAADE